MVYSYSMSLKAYPKIVLHCCRYRHLAVNGVVIGSKKYIQGDPDCSDPGYSTPALGWLLCLKSLSHRYNSFKSPSHSYLEGERAEHSRVLPRQ